MCPTFSECEYTAVWSCRVQIRFLSVGMDEKRSLQRKSKQKRRIGRSHYEQCCPHTARTPRRPQESYTYCCQEGWKVHWSRWFGFLNTYFELLQFIEIIYITNKYNQYVICLSFIPFVRIFMRNIQTAVSPHPLKIGHMFIWTYLLGKVHTTTSKNIYYSSWSTLCICYGSNLDLQMRNSDLQNRSEPLCQEEWCYMT